jgi:hypothetical protein
MLINKKIMLENKNIPKVKSIKIKKKHIYKQINDYYLHHEI